MNGSGGAMAEYSIYRCIFPTRVPSKNVYTPHHHHCFDKHT